MNGSIVAVPNAYKDSAFSISSALMTFQILHLICELIQYN